jgi:hypothetical protein
VVNGGTGDAVVGAEEDIIRQCPDSFERWPNTEKAARRRPWVDQATLALPRRYGVKSRLERQRKMGVEASARAAKAKRGLAFSFGHDHKGIQRFEAAHVEAVLHGLRVEAGRSRWQGAVRQEQPLGSGAVATDALFERALGIVGLCGSGLKHRAGPNS